jgi:hypothetical protein
VPEALALIRAAIASANSGQPVNVEY